MRRNPVTVRKHMITFLADDRGAVTVDWTVISAAAVMLAIATTAILNDTITVLSSRMDGELRTRQLGDQFIQFIPAHFEPILETGAISQEQAEAMYDIANEWLNHDIITALTEGVAGLEDGTISEEEIIGLVAIASVAHQRNIVDDGILNHYFGFDGSDPFYMTVPNAPVNSGSN